MSGENVLPHLVGKKWPVGSDGFVCLVDTMGTESSIVQAARVSYGEGTKSVSDDETLIRYLMRHRHTTPFEMVELKFHVRVPMDAWRQWIRHRTASVNEYSTRYSEAIDSMAVTKPDEWRTQSATNKQGSGGFVYEWPESVRFLDAGRNVDLEVHGEVPPYQMPVRLAGGKSPGDFLTTVEQRLHEVAQWVYQCRLRFGVAREQARKDLPLSTYTEAYWKIDLHNLLHFLSLRMDSHAQKEIRDYANVIGSIVESLYPTVWKAFMDYRMNAVTLSALDIDVIRSGRVDQITNKRERAECSEKLRRIGFIVSDIGLVSRSVSP